MINLPLAVRLAGVAGAQARNRVEYWPATCGTVPHRHASMRPAHMVAAPVPAVPWLPTVSLANQSLRRQTSGFGRAAHSINLRFWWQRA